MLSNSRVSYQYSLMPSLWVSYLLHSLNLYVLTISIIFNYIFPLITEKNDGFDLVVIARDIYLRNLRFHLWFCWVQCYVTDNYELK